MHILFILLYYLYYLFIVHLRYIVCSDAVLEQIVALFLRAIGHEIKYHSFNHKILCSTLCSITMLCFRARNFICITSVDSDK